MTPHYSLDTTVASIQAGKVEQVQEEKALSTEELQEAIIREWESLQKVLSYSERFFHVKYGLLAACPLQGEEWDS